MWPPEKFRDWTKFLNSFRSYDYGHRGSDPGVDCSSAPVAPVAGTSTNGAATGSGSARVYGTSVGELLAKYYLEQQKAVDLAFGGNGILGAPLPPLPQADVAGPLVAWRQWRLVVQVNGPHVGKWMLYSAIQPLSWPFGVPMQGDSTEDHRGVYAAKDRTRLDYQDGLRTITGQVALWGKVMEHERGYRAEYAYPVSLICPPPPMPGFPGNGLKAAIYACAENYGIPVIEEGGTDGRTGL